MKKAFLLFAGLVIGSMVMAENLPVEQAEQIAQTFLARHRPPHSQHAMRMAQRKTVGLSTPDRAPATAYYVFNVGCEEGFVIVSGSDHVPQVLGYSDRGAFDPQTLPANMRAWLDGYADQIAHIEQTGRSQEAPRRSMRRAPVGQLLGTTWGQGTPYNNQCPTDPATGERSVTGCVATALAQVLAYYRYPEQTIAPIPAYTTETSKIDMAEINVTGINWSLMADDYSGTTSALQKSAVARLMKLCGQAVQMDYGSEGSSASTRDDVYALQHYFGYGQTVRVLDRTAFSTDAWETLIYGELAARRPVIYSGQSTAGGHSFVVDGCDGDGLFHINWGWNGHYDGYFMLSVLNPTDDADIDASSGDDGFSYLQYAIVGIQHDSGEIVPELFSVYGIVYDGESTYTRTAADEDFTGISITTGLYNYTADAHEFYFNLALYDNQHNAKKYLSERGVYFGELDYQRSGAFTFDQLAFGAGLPDGDYYIVPVSGSENSEVYEDCHFSNVYRIKATIKGNTLTLANPSVSLSGTVQPTTRAVSGQRLQLTASVTNRGSYFNDYLYLFVDNEMAGGRAFEAKEGETAAFAIDFVPKTTGEKTLYLCYDDGKQYIPFTTATVSVTSGEVNSRIEVADASITVGQTAPVVLSLSNPDLQPTAYQMTLTLPEGIEIATDASGTHAYQLSDRHDSSHALTISRQPDGSYVLVCFSGANHIINGTDGPLLTLWLKASDTVTGKEPKATVSDIIMADTYGVKATLPDAGFTISIAELAQMGDVNVDGDIDVADVVQTVSHIIGNNPMPFYARYADLNGDGEINTADVVDIVSIITGTYTSSGSRLQVRASASGETTLSALLADQRLEVSLQSETAYTAFQMALTLPEGGSVGEVLIDEARRAGHIVSTGRIDDGRTMVVAYSMDNSVLHGTDGTLLNLTVTGDCSSVTVDDILFVTPQGEIQRVGSLTIENTADIQKTDVCGSGKAAPVYNLNGQRIATPARGLYIQNGRKVAKAQ